MSGEPYRLSVNANAHRPSHPTADLSVTARAPNRMITVITLRMRWRDNKPVVEWAMRDTYDPGEQASRREQLMAAAHLWGLEPEEVRDELEQARSTTFPSVTLALRAMVSAALAWEMAPIRHADRAMRSIQKLMHTIITSPPPKLPDLPEVRLDGPEVPEDRHDRVPFSAKGREAQRRTEQERERRRRADAQLAFLRQRGFEWGGVWYAQQCANNCDPVRWLKPTDSGAPKCEGCGARAEPLDMTGESFEDDET